MSALARKTVILVTHQVEFLSEVDHILVIRSLLIVFHMLLGLVPVLLLLFS